MGCSSAPLESVTAISARTGGTTPLSLPSPLREEVLEGRSSVERFHQMDRPWCRHDRPIDTLEQSTVARFAAAGARDKLRRFKEFYDGAASWDRVERIIARMTLSRKHSRVSVRRSMSRLVFIYSSPVSTRARVTIGTSPVLASRNLRELETVKAEAKTKHGATAGDP